MNELRILEQLALRLARTDHPTWRRREFYALALDILKRPVSELEGARGIDPVLDELLGPS